MASPLGHCYKLLLPRQQSNVLDGPVCPLQRYLAGTPPPLIPFSGFIPLNN